MLASLDWGPTKFNWGWPVTKSTARLLQISGAVALSAALCVPVSAQDWKDMPARNLAGLKLSYDGAWQDFRPTGRTLYNAGEDSWGYWRDQDGRYCSQWPPSDAWACYSVARAGNQIKFTDDRGHATIGVIE